MRSLEVAYINSIDHELVSKLEGKEGFLRIDVVECEVSDRNFSFVVDEDD